MTGPRVFHTATKLATGEVLIAGRMSVDYNIVTASAEIYDPIGQTFSIVGSMSVQRTEHTASLLGDGTVLIVGGSDHATQSFATGEIYHPDTMMFSVAGSMSTSGAAHAATPLELASSGSLAGTSGMARRR